MDFTGVTDSLDTTELFFYKQVQSATHLMAIDDAEEVVIVLTLNSKGGVGYGSSDASSMVFSHLKNTHIATSFHL